MKEQYSDRKYKDSGRRDRGFEKRSGSFERKDRDFERSAVDFEKTAKNSVSDIESTTIEGKNAVLEAFRAGKTIDKLFVLDGAREGAISSILREAKKHDTIVNFVNKERLDGISQTGNHQGVIAYAAAYEYAEVSDIVEAARAKG